MELKDKRIDPSEVKQIFEEVQLSIHCCRYWKFSHWRFGDLSAPFWRFYYNELPGAIVSFRNQTVELKDDSCLIIPPNTPFSIATRFDMPDEKENISGWRMEIGERMDELALRHMFDHFFIHFNLGLKLDTYNPGLYVFPATDSLRDIIGQIKLHLVQEHRRMPFQVAMRVQFCIFQTILSLPEENWTGFNYDRRVVNTLRFIDQNLPSNITNALLAQKVNLATNSFARLFRENMGVSVQQYIARKRLEKSLHMLHHTESKIERIAIECGFYDLHHFSRIFKAYMQVSPSVYKKQSTMR
jgi:AraC-like DNA-binding protein